MQLLINYLIKVNWAKATAILDLLFGQVAGNAKKIVSNNKNKIKATCIRQLSCIRIRKLYRSIVVYLAKKKDVNLFIAKSLIEIGNKMAYTKKF